MGNPQTLSSKTKKKISQAIVDLEHLNENFKVEKKLYESKKEKLQNQIKEYADTYNQEAFDIKVGRFNYRAIPIINKKITWNIDKLSEKLDKEILNEIIDKNYSINDFDGLVKYLKSCGVDPKKFKKFVDVKKVVDNKKIDELGQIGDIDLESLSGCYELQANFNYVKISKWER